MQAYSEFRPTAFDHAGAFLPDRQDWLVLGVSQTRDSGPLDRSNFETAQKILEDGRDETDDFEVHRFGHWGPGWFEIIIVKPGSRACELAEGIEESLENYPVLDEEGFSTLEWEEYGEAWESWGWYDFVRQLRDEFELPDSVYYFLEDCSTDALREFFEAGVKSGEYHIGDSSGVSVNLRGHDCTRDELAAFLWAQRKARAVA